MAVTYQLDKTGGTGNFADFIAAQNYTEAFEQALLAANAAGQIDTTGKNGVVDLTVENDAIASFRRAVALAPQDASAQQNLQRALRESRPRS